MQYVYMILSLVLGYLLGSVNTALLIGRTMGVDIRTKGSGNAGATNATRVLGKKVGIFVFLGDFLKGVLACFIGLRAAARCLDTFFRCITDLSAAKVFRPFWALFCLRIGAFS